MVVVVAPLLVPRALAAVTKSDDTASRSVTPIAAVPSTARAAATAAGRRPASAARDDGATVEEDDEEDDEGEEEEEEEEVLRPLPLKFPTLPCSVSRGISADGGAICPLPAAFFHSRDADRVDAIRGCGSGHTARE